jgi:hypothetical protein
MSTEEPTESQEQYKQPPLVSIKLTEGQVAAVLEATGVNVTELTLCELKGRDARTIQPYLLAATVFVMCW